MKGNWIEMPGGEKVAIDETIQLEIYSPFMDRENKALSNGRNINPMGNIAPGFTYVSDGYFQKLVDHIDKPTVKRRSREIKGVKLFSEGVMIDKGSLFVDEIETDLNGQVSKFNLSMILGEMDEYLELVKDKKLSDLSMGGTIEINSSPFYGSIGSWGNFVDHPYPPVGDDPDVFDLNADFVSIVAGGAVPFPSPYFRNDVFQDRGIENHAQTATRAKEWTETPHALFCFPTVIAYNKSNENGYQVINAWTPGPNIFKTYESTVNVIGGGLGEYTSYEKIDNPIVPMFYYLPVLRAIFSEFGYTLQEDWLFEDSQFQKLIFINAYSILKPLMVFATNIHDLGFDANVLYYEENTTIEAKNHLPQQSIVDFMADFCLKFNCYFEVKGKKVTIKHNEFDQLPNDDFKKTGSKHIIRLPKNTGLNLHYDLANDSYKPEKLVKKPYTTLPDESVVADLAEGDFYIETVENTIYQKLSAGNVKVCDNLIAYNSGNAKEYTMPYSPVNCAIFNYRNLLTPKSTGVPINVFVPFFNGDVVERGVKAYTYDMTSSSGPLYDGLVANWSVEHSYTFNTVEIPDEVTPDTLSLLAFYHGLMEVMEGIGPGDRAYPYASNHNYNPMATPEKIGDWHLGIIGKEGLQQTFWKKFVNIFNNNRQIIISADESIFAIRKHQWNRTKMYRGTELYVSLIRPSLPMRQWPIFECYEV